MKKKILIVNFMWISIIALIVIIYLITVKFGANDELVKYLSFGLTITSLFVGLIAIFQSFFSGDSVRRSIDVLNNASTKIASNSKNLESIVEQFDVKFGEVPGLMSDIKKQLLPNSSFANTHQNSLGEENKILTKEFITKFLNNSSSRGKIGLYAIFKSFNQKKPFRLVKSTPS